MTHPAESEIAQVLRLAFGRSVPVLAIPLPAGQFPHAWAFALDDPALPARVILHRYEPQHYARAFCAFTALQALRPRSFPVPKVYYFGWSAHAQVVLMLVEHVDGRGEEGQPHAFFARVGASFAQTLAGLHRVPWPELPDLPVIPRAYTLDNLRRSAAALGTPELQAIAGWLDETAPDVPEQPHTVVHGDYTLHSVRAEGTQIAAVLAWEHAALADPRLDVGTTSAALASYGLPLADQFVEAYEAAGGPVLDRPFWEVLGALRLLTRIAQTLAAAHPADVDDLTAQVWPVWENLLQFVEDRSQRAG